MIIGNNDIEEKPSRARPVQEGYFTQLYFSHDKDWIWENNSKDDYKLSWEQKLQDLKGASWGHSKSKSYSSGWQQIMLEIIVIITHRIKNYFFSKVFTGKSKIKFNLKEYLIKVT